MYTKASDFPTSKTIPKSASQWLEHFTKTKTVYIPSLDRTYATIDVRDFNVPSPGTEGNPDLLATLANGKQFYIKFFSESRIFYPLTIPTLYYPVDNGHLGAFWVVKDEYVLRGCISS